MIYDTIVVGAGIVGSCAAYQICLQKMKKKNLEEEGGQVLLLEQFELLHDNGSSHGNSRIIRYSYVEPIYAKMGVVVLDLWKKAEKESGMNVYFQKGGIDIGYENEKSIQDVLNSSKMNQYPIKIFKSQEEIKQTFPLINYQQGMVVVYQETTGILNALEAVRMFLFLAAKNGCIIHERERLTSYRKTMTPTGEECILVQTDKGQYFARKIVLCCGAWSQNVISMYGSDQIDIDHHHHHYHYMDNKDTGISYKKVSPGEKKTVNRMDFDVQLMSYAFWKIKKEYEDLWKKMPVWIHYSKQNENHDHLGEYGFPIFDQEMHGHIKASLHYPLPNERYIDPDHRSREMPLEKLKTIRKFLKHMFLEDSFDFESFDSMKNNNKTQTCLYTRTPSSDFVIDTHPLNKNIAIFAGGSGHAFKFGPLLGLMLLQLIKDPNTKMFLDQFDRSRFSIQHVISKSKL